MRQQGDKLTTEKTGSIMVFMLIQENNCTVNFL